MAEITKELGRIPISRGDYQATTEYYKDNIVQYKRSSYQVVSESPIIGIPPINDKNIVNSGWTLFAGTLDAQDVVNQVKDQETKSIQAVADREAEILAKSDAAEVSFDNTGTSISGTNVQDALEKTDSKLSKLESEVIYDVTTNNDGAIFPSLSALLSSENLSILIPTSVRYGGMSIRFIQSSDNKYVQYRLMSPTWSTDVVNWQGVDTELIRGSHNFVENGVVSEPILNMKDCAFSEVAQSEIYQSSSLWTYEPSKQCSKYGYTDGGDTYDSVQMLVGSNMDIWVKNYDGSNFTICVFPSGIIPDGTYDSSASRYRSVDSNLPTESNKASITSGSMLVVTYPKGSNFVLGGNFGSKYALKTNIVSESNLDSALRSKINNPSVGYNNLDSELKTIIDNCDITEEIELSVVDSLYSEFVKKEEKTLNYKGDYIDASNYDSYELEITEVQNDFYPVTLDYNAIVSGSNIEVTVFDGSVDSSHRIERHRAAFDDFSTFPQQSNPMSLSVGRIVVITVPHGSTFTLHGTFLSWKRKLIESIVVNKENLSEEIQELIPSVTILQVGSGKQYSTIKAAIDACINPTKNNQYVIEFYGDGTEYDLSAETAAWNQEHPTEAIGMILPPYTTLRGIGGKSKCILALRLSEASTDISPLNIRTTTSLEGLTVIGNNTRYVIHDDYRTVADKLYFERTIKNCDFIGEYLAYATTWGAGTYSGCKWTFENCIFKSTRSGGYPFACHNNKHFTEPARLWFINCRFIHPNNNQGPSFGTISNEANGIICEATFIGNKMNRLILQEQAVATYGAGCLWRVTGFGNDLKTGDSAIEINVTDGQDYSDRIDLI